MNLDQLTTAIRGLSDADRAELTAKLSAGAAPKHGKLQTIAQLSASAATNHDLSQSLRLVKAMAYRHNVDLGPANEPINLTVVDRQMRDNKVSISDRMELKTLMYRLGLIPA